MVVVDPYGVSRLNLRGGKGGKEVVVSVVLM